VLRTIAGLDDGSLQPRPQDPSKVTLAPKLTKAEGRIDFADSASSLANRIRGVWPWPGAHAEFVRAGRGPVSVLLSKARALPDGPASRAAVGEVTADSRIQTGRGRLEILEIQVAGKRLMTWRDFVNGYHVAAGDRFVAPGAP
jgi:methionyl-tRNA formyltransferase